MRNIAAALILAALLVPATAQPAAEPVPAWRTSALTFVPDGYIGGAAHQVDATTGVLAIYRADASDPKSHASVFAPQRVFVVKLAGNTAVSAEMKMRDELPRANRDTTQTDPNGTEAEYAKLHKQLADARAKLPPGTEPCDLRAWSEDKDPKGLNVRAEPSAASRILGTLPPPYRIKGHDNSPQDGWLTEFRIVGFKNGWFLIEGAKPPGKDYEDESTYPRDAPKPYAGRGWVAANKVGANFSNGGTRMGGLFHAPFVDARWTPVKDKSGNPISVDGGPQRLLACSGPWGLVEAHGARGWWRSLCSNQVTNCS